MPLRFAALTTAVLALLVASACSDPSDPRSGLAIDPPHVVLEEGARQAFAAVGFDEAGIEWQASGGELAERGEAIEWEAPFEPGEYTITVFSALDPALTAVATVEVVSAEGASAVNFSGYRGTAETLPAGMFVTGEDGSGVPAGSGTPGTGRRAAAGCPPTGAGCPPRTPRPGLRN
jgi:hypothetical protein